MGDSDNESGGAQNNASNADLSSPKEQDRFLPIANVSRIMKKALPANAKISKEAKETVQECVSEFISFITGEASDKCQKEKRKTINGDDLLWAMTTLGFEDYVDPLKVYLQRFREMEGEKIAVARDKDAPLGGGGGAGAGSSGIYGMMVHQHQGHVYGSSGFHQMGRGPSTLQEHDSSVGGSGNKISKTEERPDAILATAAKILKKYQEYEQTCVMLVAKIVGLCWRYQPVPHPAELTVGYYNTALRDDYDPVVSVLSRHGTALHIL
ncbi:hypothetical protein V6N13_067021 [Hibiscus sabdariffa]|uniref:Beta-amylase n=1 Tax=Hibiscus sabdariffa TaxID=183260 RepID=A0ABR2DS68_9ROSI